MLPLALDQYHFKFDQHPHNLSNFVKLKVVSQFRLSKSTLSKCLNFWFDQFASENCQRLCQEEEQEEWPHACPSGYWSCPLEAEPAGAPHPPPTTPPSARQPPSCLLGQLRAARRLSAMQWLYTQARSAEQKRH